MDIRLDVDFFDHPKVIKLERRLGVDGVKALLVLWTWCARHRSDGVLLNMDDDDIEIAAEWCGEVGVLASSLRELRWIDTQNGVMVLHEWSEHQPWASEAGTRSNVARFARLAGVFPDAYPYLLAWGYGRIGVTKAQYKRISDLLDAIRPDQDIVSVLAEFAPTGDSDAALTDVDAALTDVDAALTPSPVPSPVLSPVTDRISREVSEQGVEVPDEQSRGVTLYNADSVDSADNSVYQEQWQPTLAQITAFFRKLPGHNPNKSYDSDLAWIAKVRKDFPVRGFECFEICPTF